MHREHNRPKRWNSAHGAGGAHRQHTAAPIQQGQAADFTFASVPIGTPGNEPSAEILHADRQTVNSSTGGKVRGPDSLTKEQIAEILENSKDLSDFKLNLSLGPVSDVALEKYLASKQFKVPDTDPKQKQQKYIGPSIGPSNEPYNRRRRYIRTPVDDPLQYELTEVYETPEEAEEMQRQVDIKEGSDRAGAALAAAAGGGSRGAASRAFIANAEARPGAAVGSPRTQSAGQNREVDISPSAPTAGYGSPIRTNTGSTQVFDKNCGDCVGALLEGRGSTSTGLADRANRPEGWKATPNVLKNQLANVGIVTGPTLSASSEADLISQLQALPVGSRVAIFYTNPQRPGIDPATGQPYVSTGHFISGFVGKNRKYIFVDPQPAAGATTTIIPQGATNIGYFGVVPATR